MHHTESNTRSKICIMKIENILNQHENGSLQSHHHKSTQANSAAPQAWMHPDLHFSAAIESPWYRLIFLLYANITHVSTDFFRKLNFQPALMPVTCQSISSPMGLGSDSLPVSIDLLESEPTWSTPCSFSSNTFSSRGFRASTILCRRFVEKTPTRLI